MRRLLALALALMPAAAPTQTLAQTVTGTWELLAIDGVFTDTPVTLTIDEGGTFSGKAPCNGFSASNRAQLPALQLGGIRATRMACDRLEEEQAFFDALSVMTEVRLEGLRNLILSAPDGRSLEFVPMVMNSLTVCTTCPPKE
jgi:heat shock protein HslJ